MSHFNLKSLTFYGVAITLVLGLFKVVSAYGESNLQAAPAIGGTYRFHGESLANCLQSQNLVLEIQQSGIYLSGLLLPEKANNSTAIYREKKPSLFGKWHNQGFTLSGSIPVLAACNHDPNQPVTIEATWEQDTLTGQIKLNSRQLDFMAKREITNQSTNQAH